MYKFYQYTENLCRIVISKGNLTHDTEKDDTYIKPSYNASDVCSLSRARRMIREISLCNDFTYFFTSTVNSELADRYSLTESQKKIRRCMKTIKAKNHDFIYLFITEKHKDGAFHFHGLCNNLDLYVNSNGYLSSKDFDRIGFNSFSTIKSKEKVSNYITKYITKDCVKNESGSVYFCSRGLRHADSYEIAPLDLDKLNLPLWQNDYIKICDFDISKLSKEQNLYLMTQIKEKNNFLTLICDKQFGNL